MPSLKNIGYYAFHPGELRSIAQWAIWHNPVHERDFDADPLSLKACFKFLDLTSRSFSAVIKELNPELLVPVCIFYLVLRALDTIEDDMTIALEEKDPLLREFHIILEKDGWTYSGNGPNEKDRDLLVHFHYVVTEFKKIKEPYKIIIKDICKKMGAGMADFCHLAELEKGVDTIEDYELYCHYVAGLVGEGLTRLFVESGLANPQLLQRPDLYESMGQLLQQTNVIRDIREDRDDRRRFWPKEVWSKYVDNFDDLFEPKNRDMAMRCSAEMILLALQRAPDCLFYLAGIRDQSVFNFAAIPQSMAIATLDACFRNPKLFDPKPVKITRGEACQLMLESSQNLQILYNAFKVRARRIHKKNDPRDPNFLKVSIACGKIEQFIESIFPSQDPRVIHAPSVVNGTASTPIVEMTGRNAELAEKKRKADEEAKKELRIMVAAVMIFMTIVFGTMMFVAWLAGARFDLVYESLKNTTREFFGKEDLKLSKPGGSSTPLHPEL